MTEQKAVRRLDEIRAQASEVPGVAVRRLKRVEEVELKVLDVDPGLATPLHVHPHAHEGIILAGSGALRGNDGTQPLTSGDSFSIDPNEPHAIESHGPEPLCIVCLDCFLD
jgi:quercetin dioxygenase-like cupin family protein